MNKIIGMKQIVVIAALMLLGLGNMWAASRPDQISILVPSNHVNYNASMGGPIGSYVYREWDNRFYISTYGSNRGIRCYVDNDTDIPVWAENPLSSTNGNSWQCATESDLTRIAGSLDMEAGLFNSDYPASSIISGMLLNPAPVTINGIEYGAGELAIISDNSRALTSSATKRLIRWDLREIWSPTDKQPDRANAEYDHGQLMVDIFGAQYGYGCTNWNDAYAPVMTLQDMADAIDAGNVGVTLSDNVGGRRAVFSNDGKKVYFVSKDVRSTKLFTGLWGVEIETGKVQRLIDDTASNSSLVTASEPGVLSTAVRNMTGLPLAGAIDQVLFNGTEVTGNVCGLNAYLDDDQISDRVYPVINGQEILNFTENYDPNWADPGSLPKIWSVTADDIGNIYFYLSQTYGLYKYDLQGRLICLVSRPEHYSFNQTVGSSSSNTTYYRLSTRQIIPEYEDPNAAVVEPLTQVMYMSVAGKCVAGVTDYIPCDFNRDGIVNVGDMKFFKTQLDLTAAEDVPLMADSVVYTDYLKADLNGSGVLNEDKTGLEFAAVTLKDIEILHQFVLPGNVNFDDRVNFDDFIILTSNYMQPGDKDWSQGDFNFDGVVDIQDLLLLAEFWLMEDD